MLEKDLTADRLAEINQKLQTHEISVYMPKFKTTTEFLLNERLKAAQPFGTATPTSPV